MAVIAHIEDNPADHVLLRAMLPKDHDLYHYPDLDSFFETAQQFDLIITDLRLPKTYGFETIEHIRGFYPDTPILALTGMAGPYMTGDIIKTLLECGADNVVSKEIMCDSRIVSLVNDLLNS